jgi:hypothetical protein
MPAPSFVPGRERTSRTRRSAALGFLALLSVPLAAIPAQEFVARRYLERARRESTEGDLDAVIAWSRAGLGVALRLEATRERDALIDEIEELLAADPSRALWKEASERTADLLFDLGKRYAKRRWYRAGSWLLDHALGVSADRKIERVRATHLRRVEQDGGLPWSGDSIVFDDEHPLRNRLQDLSASFTRGDWERQDAHLVVPPLRKNLGFSPVWLTNEVLADGTMRARIQFDAGDGTGQTFGGLIVGAVDEDDYFIIDLVDGDESTFCAVYSWQRGANPDVRQLGIINCPLEFERPNDVAVRIDGQKLLVVANRRELRVDCPRPAHGRIGFYVSGASHGVGVRFGPLQIAPAGQPAAEAMLGDVASLHALLDGLADSADVEGEVFAVRAAVRRLRAMPPSPLVDGAIERAAGVLAEADGDDTAFVAAFAEIATLWHEVGQNDLARSRPDSALVALAIGARFDPRVVAETKQRAREELRKKREQKKAEKKAGDAGREESTGSGDSGGR